MKVCAIFARAMKLSDNGWRRIRYPFIPVYSIDDATLLKTEFGKKKTFVTFFFLSFFSIEQLSMIHNFSSPTS